MIHRTILRNMTKTYKIKCSKINSVILTNGNLAIEKVNEVFRNLEDLNHGEQRQIFSSNHTKVNYFFRLTLSQMNSSEEAQQNIVDLGLDLNEVLNTLRETEAIEANETFLNQNNKRTVNSEEPSDLNQIAKRHKISSSSSNLMVNTRSDNGVPYELKASAPKQNRLPIAPIVFNNNNIDNNTIFENQIIDETIVNNDNSLTIPQTNLNINQYTEDVLNENNIQPIDTFENNNIQASSSQIANQTDLIISNIPEPIQTTQNNILVTNNIEIETQSNQSNDIDNSEDVYKKDDKFFRVINGKEVRVSEKGNRIGKPPGSRKMLFFRKRPTLSSIQ